VRGGMEYQMSLVVNIEQTTTTGKIAVAIDLLSLAGIG
jgi:hypothetical protein